MTLLISVAVVSMLAGCGIALIAIGVCQTGRRADRCWRCDGEGDRNERLH